MKTQADLEARLMDELRVWFPRQSRNISDDFYLYYLPSGPEHDGGILICSEKPNNPEYKLAWSERINKGFTVEQNFFYLRKVILFKLPVLS
jgi:hypothetical protein